MATANSVKTSQHPEIDRRRTFGIISHPDAEGNLAYLAASVWQLKYMKEQWPDIEFHQTRECQ